MIGWKVAFYDMLCQMEELDSISDALSKVSESSEVREMKECIVARREEVLEDETNPQGYMQQTYGMYVGIKYGNRNLASLMAVLEKFPEKYQQKYRELTESGATIVRDEAGLYREAKEGESNPISPIHGGEECPDCMSEKNGFSSHCRTCGAPRVF